MDSKGIPRDVQGCIEGWTVYHADRIAYHEECIRMLKEERNQLQPISRLPPEILGIVFSFVLAEFKYPRTLANIPFPLYYFTYVSRSWRSVALNTPRLWQVIIPLRRRWSIAALERSKAADLFLLSRLQSLDSPDSVSLLKQLLTKHASRVRDLDIDLGQFDLPTLAAMFQDLQPSSLRLHSLKMISYLRTDSNPTFPTGVVVTDSLQRLEIRCCNGPWYSMSFPALTSLNLCHIQNRPPLSEFLELLQGLTALQFLDMEDSLPFAARSEHANFPIAPIHLPSLQYLRLCSTKNQKEVSNILSCITVPPTATLRLVVVTQGSEENVPNVDALASSFSVFVSHMGQSLSYSTLHIQSVAPPAYHWCAPWQSLQPVCNTLRHLSSVTGHIHFRAWDDDDGSISSGAPNLEVVVAPKEHPTPIAPHVVVQKIFPSLPLFDITTLTLEIDPVGDLLQHTIGNLPHLRKVTVVGDCTVKFIEELTRRRNNYDDRHPSDYHSVTFPALEFLWIRKADFSKEGSCTVEGLQECLMERYERKAEILKLKLTNCRKVFRSYVEKLREIVVDVEWDEQELVLVSEY